MTTRTLRQEFGTSLWDLADLIRASQTRRSFRSKAYHRAVWSLDDLSEDLDEAFEDLVAVPGIGPGTAGLIQEFKDSGHLEELDELSLSYPVESPRMARLPRMNPALLRSMKAGFEVETLDDLAFGIDSGALLALKGVGPATLDLWRAILQLSPGDGYLPAHRSWAFAMDLGSHLHRHLGVEAFVTGEVRRGVEWVSRLDLVLAVDGPMAIRAFLNTTALSEDTSWVADDESVLETHPGLPAHIHLSSPSDVGSKLLITTGPPSHVEQIQRANPGGKFRTEEDFYRASQREWIPPGARSLSSLSEQAKVIKAEEIRGDLHIHSEWSPDGRMELDDLLAAVVDIGYSYILITDHTIGLRFGGLDADALWRQAAEIDSLRERYPRLRIFHGAELNVSADGSLDIDDEALDLLDMAVAGVHSYFGLDREAQTERLVTALNHPKVGVLAHPTGRRIGIRPGLEFDFEEIVDASLRQNVAIESNGHRDRLDVSAAMARSALERGALLVANSDAHRFGELNNVSNSVSTLQAAGVPAESVVNTWDLERFETWVRLHGRRSS